MKEFLAKRYSEPSTYYATASALFGVLVAFGIPVTPGQISAVMILIGVVSGVTPDVGNK